MTDRELVSVKQARAVERPLCRCLRWKGQFVEVEVDPEMPAMSDGFVWCNRTMNCLGPDGQVADRVSCGQERACFEPRGSRTKLGRRP